MKSIYEAPCILIPWFCIPVVLQVVGRSFVFGTPQYTQQ